MDHVIDCSEAAYEGTAREKDFIIFHDGLSEWWEAGAQEHMERRGYKNRQLRNITANLDNRYAFKVVGDSPEICRALDSHVFADLKAALLKYSSLTSLYPVGDQRRFDLGTPAQLLSSLERAWDVAPTPARIVQDIEVFEDILDAIIDWNGISIADGYLRSGRRERRLDDKAELKNKVRAKQRASEIKSTVPEHPDV